MGFWDGFKEGLAVRAGAEALGFIPRILRGFFKWLFIIIAAIIVMAFFKFFWPVVVLSVLIFAAWRWRRRHSDGEKN